MQHIVLLKDRTDAQEVVITIAVPLIFGIITGIFLGISEPVYLVLSILGIGGGYLAGLEHEYALEGFYRGVLGGLLFGFGILLAHGIADKAPKADLPDPEILVILITTVFGAGLGTLGARRREKWLKKNRQATAEMPRSAAADPQTSSTASASR